MKRGLLGTIVWTVLAAGIGIGLFFIKHEVKDQKRRLNALNAEIQRNQETIHVLRAEWSYLNDPTRLKGLAEKHLGMHAVRATEVATLESVLRDGVPPATMLAAATLPRQAQPGTAVKPTAPAPMPRQQIKLAETPMAPRPADTAKPPQPKPQPQKPGGVTVAKTEAPPPPASAALVRGGRGIVVKSPALAESVGAQDRGDSR